MVHAVAGEHVTQEAGALANVPTGHVDAVCTQEVAPAVLYDPAAHGVHTAENELPVKLEYVPAGQGRLEIAYTPPKLAAWQKLAPKGDREVDSVEEMPGSAQEGERPENH